MNIEELIKKQPSEIRNSNELMMAYVSYFKKKFNYSPDCAGCTFSNDWNVFVSSVQNQNINFKKEIMSKSFEIRDRSKIYSYRKEGQLVARCYGSDMTEEFANEYLANGTQEEIEERKKEFKVLPIADAVDEIEVLEEEEIQTEEIEEVQKVLPIADAVVNKNNRGNNRR
jgi:hypothetical protein